MLGARHPGLSGRVVPIDIRLGDGYTALLITGPNTGGKTVALRTLGLLSLMHQSGLHVPAEVGTRLPVLLDVYADIGDEQSVAQSLSTFSGHMRSIVRVVEAAGPNRLVLLDELGAGTDPTEGSALAQALLDHFIKAGALVAATTHYAELKLYAHTTPQARNASVEFDVETLRPTYRLSIGLPGQSQAFAIAERLGLPTAIVADARSRLTDEQQAFEETLASIKATQRETAEALARARTAEDRARVALVSAEEERRRARRERDESVKAARDEAERLVDDVRAEVRDDPPPARARDGDAAQPRRGPGAGPDTAGAPPCSRARTGPDDAPGRGRLAHGNARPQHQRRMGGSRRRAGQGRPAGDARGGRDTGDGAVGGPGAGRRRGRGGGGRRFQAGRPPPGFAPPTRSPGGARPGCSWSAPAPSRRRWTFAARRSSEALEVLDRYLDDASLAGLDQATIIHGLGTGALRDAVREYASAHPLVKSWRPGGRGEGGDGATVVAL